MTDPTGKPDDVIAREAARMRAAARAEEKRQDELNLTVATQREAARAEWADSELGDVAAQIAESERIMRLPTPDANEALGIKEPNPLKGPSS
jgi:hypothetical protein